MFHSTTSESDVQLRDKTSLPVTEVLIERTNNAWELDIFRKILIM